MFKKDALKVVSGLNANSVNPYVRAMHKKLTLGFEGQVITLSGDSTGNGGDEWFYLSMQALARKYPKYTFVHKLWNDAKQAYDPYRGLSGIYSKMQYGTNGDAYATFPGAAGSYVSCPDSNKLDITGDIDVRAKIAPDVWNTGAEYQIVAKFGTTSANRSWRMVMSNAGLLGFQWQDATTAQFTQYSTSALATAGAVNGQPKWVRATLDVDNGSSGHTVKFYTSTDGENWSALGTDRVVAGTTSIFSGPDAIELGSRGGGTIADFVGKIYEVQIFNGIDGVPVATPDFDMAFPKGIASFKDSEGNTWTINGSIIAGNGSPGVLILNGSHPGASLAYGADATRINLQQPMEPALTFVSYSHNDSNIVGSYAASYQSFLDQIKTKYPYAGIVCVTQNPKYTPATNIENHAIRCTRIIPAVAAKNGCGLIDGFDAIYNGMPGWEAGMDGIGVHIGAQGNIVWSKATTDFLQI